MMLNTPYSGPKFFRPSPKLFLNFAGDKSLDPRITFTRASSGTYDDATGAKQTALPNVARFTHDSVTLQSLGLLIEEARTNLLLNSETLSTQNVTVSATPYTLSFQGTGTVTLSGVSAAGPLVGTSAQAKVSLTFTPTAGTLTVTVSGSVKYANVEAGSFALSWIPTVASTATRAADNASMTGSNFSSWYNQSEGTFVASERLIGQTPPQSSILMQATDATLNSYISIQSFALEPQALISASGVIGLQIVKGSVVTIGALRSESLAYKVNDSAVSFDGGSAALDTSVSIPTLDRLTIGKTNNFGVQYANTTIASIAYYPKRLSNSQLPTT